jgi:hypothetical protein
VTLLVFDEGGVNAPLSKYSVICKSPLPLFCSFNIVHTVFLNANQLLMLLVFDLMFFHFFMIPSLSINLGDPHYPRPKRKISNFVTKRRIKNIMTIPHHVLCQSFGPKSEIRARPTFMGISFFVPQITHRLG